MTDRHVFEVTMHITEKEREKIISDMSRAMGEYIMKIGVTDFAKWTPEQWAGLMAAGFDLVAPQVFMKRICVSPPYTLETVPF